jgi:hypothetical protein
MTVALLALVLATAANVACAAVVCVLVLHQAPWRAAYEPVPHDPPGWEALHWVPTKQAGRLQRILREQGFFVLNAGSTNGVTALMICEAL